MKITQFQNNYLYEGLDRSATHSMMLWESAGFKLKEAALTADQIQQIFQNVEQGATDAGSNRTLLGKGKDATMAVNKAWEDLKTKIQDSGPIKNVDNAYDSAIAKIEQGLGGPDNALSKVIMRYRKFAKEYPISQGIIYSILIAAAGITGAGLGGAAVLGLFKLTDKLLQGEKFSSAAYSGAKTGAMAYGASKIGDLIKGKPEGGVPAAPAAPVPSADAVTAPADIVAKGYKAVMRSAIDAGKNYANNGGATDYSSVQSAAEEFGSALMAQGMGQGQANNMVQVFKTAAQGAATKALGGAAQSTMGGALQAVTNSVDWTGKKLSEGQVYMIFNRVSAQQQLTEGPMDFIKGAAAKGMDKLKTVGKNLTTKVTADKLNSAWKKAGSPMDSEELKQFLLSYGGIEAPVVDKVFTDLKISAAPAAQAATGGYADVKKLIMQLNNKDRQRMITYLTKQLGTA
jgi:hypothetical protein